MRNVILLGKSFILLASLLTLSALNEPGTTHAAGTSIAPSPISTFMVQGAWYDSGVTLAEDARASLYHTSILISDRSLLRENWMIKLDTEYMEILELIEGGVGQPDTMVVKKRGANGSTTAYHPMGSPIKAQTETIYIWANEVTDSWGLGAFEVAITLPPDVQYVKMTPKYTWLESTGRNAWCDGPFQSGNTWRVSCLTTGNLEDSRYPIGVKGSGIIAKVVLHPSQVAQLNTISLTGSRLLNNLGSTILSTIRNINIRVVECPDANADGRVNSIDVLSVAKNFGDRGRDSDATLLAAVNDSQPVMSISDQSLLSLGATISLDAEQMTVLELNEATPDTMTVTRAIYYTPARPHNAGVHIYIATDGGMDGKLGYTVARDATRDGIINSTDVLLVAKMVGMTCGGS